MNGRVYDYNLGRFLSVDPFIQDPGNSQSMNPYSYIMNNPLSGTDPSGYAACSEVAEGGSCNVGDIKTKAIDNITITKDGNAIVNTTDGKSFKVETRNGKDVQGSFKGTNDKFSQGIENLGSVVDNMSPADNNFNPNNSEFRLDEGDPRNDYGSEEYNKNNQTSQKSGDFTAMSFGHEYSWRPVSGKHRYTTSDWVLIREPTSGEVIEDVTLTILSQVPSSKLVSGGTATARAFKGVASKVSPPSNNRYIWQNETNQERLYAEYRVKVFRVTKGNASSQSSETNRYPGSKRTGRIRWGIIPRTKTSSTRKLEFKYQDPNLPPY
ncbi:MAG: hypothetical protein ACI9N9_002055 [Enterobacterales bacterium]|jgi:hypothetical protein